MREPLAPHPFDIFDEVRIINLVDRDDRRREMSQQLERLGGSGNASFFEAHRPVSRGEFPSIGARGCFESHLAVLSGARDSGAQTLLLLEDDFEFTREGVERVGPVVTQLSTKPWSIFYGAHLLDQESRNGLIELAPKQPVLTASFVAFRGQVIPELVDFLEALLKRPAGSPDYGPMHVDGAYTVFRDLNPQYQTFAAFPPLGRQRSSRSDITPGLFDRSIATRGIAALLRRGYNRLQRQ